MIHVMKYRNKKTFIYDAIRNESNLCQQRASLTQNSVYSEGSNNYFVQNMNHSQFGRHMNVDEPFTNVINNTINQSVDPNKYFSI